LFFLISNRTTCQLEKNVLKVGQNCPEIRDPDPILGQAMNRLGNKIVAAPNNREALLDAGHRRNSWELLKELFRGCVFRIENHGSLWAMPGNQTLWRVDIDDPAMLNDRYAIA
jgi:hypothetical protein